MPAESHSLNDLIGAKPDYAAILSFFHFLILSFQSAHHLIGNGFHTLLRGMALLLVDVVKLD